MEVRIQNAALATKTLLYNGARAVQQPSDVDLPSFFDLCSLLEASVILDRVYSIESVGSVPDLALTNRLRREGLLADLRPAITLRDLSRTALRLPDLLADHIPAHFWRSLVEPTAGSPPNEALQNSATKRPFGSVEPTGAMTGLDYSAGLRALHEQLVKIVTYPSQRGSPKVPERVFRSYGYLVVAASHGLDYFPDFDRAPFIAGCIKRLYQSMPSEVYERVARSFEEVMGEGEQVTDWTLDAELPIPPVSAIVLNRARTLGEIPDQLLATRAEFAGYRRYFADFKAEWRDADTYRRRRKLLARYQDLLKTASGPSPQFVSVIEALNFAQSTVKAAAVPALPTSYEASLIIQPLEWARRWWLRRPLAVLFRLDSKLPRISEYRQLIRKHWGSDLNDQLVANYAAHALEVRHLMTTKVEGDHPIDQVVGENRQRPDAPGGVG